MSNPQEIVEMPKATVQRLKCRRCPKEWYPKPGRGRPQVCPRCKSYDWDKPRIRAKRTVIQHAA